MCGICGIFDCTGARRSDRRVAGKMAARLFHRGPDGSNFYTHPGGNLALGFTRLSIIDLEGGMQPIFNEDQTVVVVCNGEIFNYIELREELIAAGHRFRTKTDVEVLVHLYEEQGTGFLNRLNGQFSFALFDLRQGLLFCARDHFGVLPFFYTVQDGLFIFASEIKAILEHPAVRPRVDMTGLDQVFSFPGLISPRTMFAGIRSLENGHYLVVQSLDNAVSLRDEEYWDLDYPQAVDIIPEKSEKHYVEDLLRLLDRSIELRLRSDVPVGFYVSGGLDSSFISVLARRRLKGHGERSHSFSIDFAEREISESRYQRLVAQYIDSIHHEHMFLFSDIGSRLEKAVFHSECALKETYNTASLALSQAVHDHGIKVILTGEGADEFFAGYVGYRFDRMRRLQPPAVTPQTPFEQEIRHRLWGDENFFYEKNQYAFRETKKALYSPLVRENYEAIDCLGHFVVNPRRLVGRDDVHKRSYIDYKLRMSDHLISDHGDRMAMAHSVEARYPFLDRELVEYAARIPPSLKLCDFEEKYILKKAAAGIVPQEIIDREKFGFVAPGSPYLLKRGIEYIEDILSYERIRRQGYFDPGMVEALKKRYMQEGFQLNMPFESDLLIIVLTFGIFLDQFGMPALA